MLRSIRSTALLGTLLLAGSAAAQTKAAAKAPASDDSLIESSKPGNPPAAIPVPAAAKADEASAPVAVPAPPPPVDDEGAAQAAPSAPRKRTLSGAGLSTQSTTQGGVGDVSDSASEKDWGFRFKGFFRGPMRLGFDNSGNLTPNTMQLHSPPVVPDGNYTRWMYTNINPGPWAELLFQYGNQRVMMTTSIASYNITSGGWRELQDQLGIDRAFLTLKFPEALGNVGGMAWDVGVFSNLYGAAGKYDAGEYETYLIARTRIAGATATADMELNDDLKLVLEAGGGAKMDQQYQRYQVSQGSPVLGDATYDYPSWQPFPGNHVQQGTNVLLHGHAGLVLNGILTATFHYLDAFVKDARWNVGTTGGSPSSTPPTAANIVPGDGSIQIFGFDLKLNGGYLGDGYLGASYVKAHHAASVSDSVELLHSQGGSYLVANYFTSPAQAKTGATPDGNGNILSVGGQYTFSVASFMMRPRPFWGQAADVTIRPFFMYNKVSGTQGGAADVSKLKGGLDVIYSFMPMMAVGLRGDVVQPNMSNSHQSFAVITPKAIFRSEFVTHEMIVLSVSKYFYGAEYTDKATSSGVMPWPYGQFGTNSTAFYGANGSPPDSWLINLSANMWW